MSTFSKRLKQARLRKGLSQEELGLDAGLDPMSASTRMNRYELGKRSPDFALIEKIADVLEVPAAYFFATDEVLAELIASYSNLSKEQQELLVKKWIQEANSKT